MESTFHGNFNEEITFPYLGTAKGTNNGKYIVLFYRFGCGTVIWTEDGYKGHPIGSYSESWIGENFEPINGYVTLSNV